MLDIVAYGNEILAQKSEPVTDFGPDFAAFVEELYVSMQEGRGVGLAAVQVSQLKRVFVTGVEDDKLRVFANPEIIFTSPDEVVYEEGCLSLPGLYTKVKRPASVKIQAYNEKGRPFTLEATDFLARVILHEYDHLNGVLFIDRLTPHGKERALSQYLKRTRM